MVSYYFLLNEVPSERFEELNYEDKLKSTSGFDNISLSLKQKICEHTDLLEWRLGIHAELIKDYKTFHVQF
jgi:hypothetical protein